MPPNQPGLPWTLAMMFKSLHPPLAHIDAHIWSSPCLIGVLWKLGVQNPRNIQQVTWHWLGQMRYPKRVASRHGDFDQNNGGHGSWKWNLWGLSWIQNHWEGSMEGVDDTDDEWVKLDMGWRYECDVSFWMGADLKLEERWLWYIGRSWGTPKASEDPYKYGKWYVWWWEGCRGQIWSCLIIWKTWSKWLEGVKCLRCAPKCSEDCGVVVCRLNKTSDYPGHPKSPPVPVVVTSCNTNALWALGVAGGWCRS